MPYKDKSRQREYGRDWKNRRRIEWILANGPCKCGSWENVEVDHIDPSQKVDHRIWSWSRERREKELAKCQVLCGKCHTAKTTEEKTKEMVHGTSHAYDMRRCRCSLCKEANTARCRRYRQNRALARSNGRTAVCGTALRRFDSFR